MGFKQPTNDVFQLLLVERKFTTITKMSWPPFDIQRSKMHVAIRHFAKVGCTYFVKVLLTNVRRMSSMKAFLDGKFTLRRNQKINLYNQINLIYLNGKKPLMKKTLCLPRIFFGFHDFVRTCLNRKKKLEIALGLIFCHLVFSS
jgi:hypothetical protein